MVILIARKSPYNVVRHAAGSSYVLLSSDRHSSPPLSVLRPIPTGYLWQGRRRPDGILLAVTFLGLIVTSFAVQARRLHDINQTGWLVLAGVALNILAGLGTIFLYRYRCAHPGRC